MGKGERGSAASTREVKDRALSQIQSALGRRVSSWYAIPDQHSLPNQWHTSSVTYTRRVLARLPASADLILQSSDHTRPGYVRVKAAAQPKFEMVDLICFFSFISEKGQPNV